MFSTVPISVQLICMDLRMGKGDSDRVAGIGRMFKVPSAELESVLSMGHFHLKRYVAKQAT